MGCPAKFPEADIGNGPAVSAIRATDQGADGGRPRRPAVFADDGAVAPDRGQGLEIIHSAVVARPVGTPRRGFAMQASISHAEQEGL